MDNRYPDDWHSRSREIKKRDNYTCQNCGSRGGPKGNAELHAHHIVPISDGGSHKKSNLKTLCKDCHDAIHHNNKVAPTGERRTNKTSSTSEYSYQNYNEDSGFSILRAFSKLYGGIFVLIGVAFAFFWPIMLASAIFASISLLIQPEIVAGAQPEGVFLLMFSFPIGMFSTYAGVLIWNIGCIGQDEEKNLSYSKNTFPVKYYWWWINKFTEIKDIFYQSS